MSDEEVCPIDCLNAQEYRRKVNDPEHGFTWPPTKEDWEGSEEV